MELKGKQVLVIGAGISGIAAARLLTEAEAEVTLYDSNCKLKAEEIKEKLPQSVKVVIGEYTEQPADIFVLSPGVATDLEFVLEAQRKGVLIIGEIELAYQFAKGRIAAITGTNGKTTTTTLLGEIFKLYYESVFVVGNIGVPYTELVLQTEDTSVTAVEVSSFQLETVKDFKPLVSAILNITPDHLNRHHTMGKYAEAKCNIAKNQDEKDICILNYEDALLREVGKNLKTNVVYFSSKRVLEQGIYLDGEEIIYRDNGKRIKICNINELQIFGLHNYENVMAAVVAAFCMGVPLEKVQEGLRAFRAVEHRIEYVTTIRGVSYYNDSKGTNPDASMKAIEAMKSDTVLIAGGYDKGGEFDDWIATFDNKIKCLVLLGQTREKIARTARKLGFEQIVMVETLEEAVKVSAEKSKEGDSVLLSPACASWGMFPNYEERGRLFKEYVNQLKG